MSILKDWSDHMQRLFLYPNPGPETLLPHEWKRTHYLPWWEAVVTRFDDLAVEVLTGLGIDPDKKCPKYFTPPDMHYPGGYTFLELAASWGCFLDPKNYRVGEMVIKLGANVNAITETRSFVYKYRSLLQLAIINARILCVKLLLENGARLEGYEGFHAMALAMSSMSAEISTISQILGLLFEYGIDPKGCDPKGSNFLHCLIYMYTLKTENLQYDILEIAKTLVEAGVPINGTNDDRLAPLHLAIHRNDSKLAAYLIEKGADVGMKTAKNFLPVEETVRYGSKNVLELFLDRGVDVNARYSNGSTLLHLACLQNESQIIDFLLRKGAEISPRNDSNLTPFALLNLDDNDQRSSIVSMIKEFSRLTVKICDSDWVLIRKHQKTHKIFKNCNQELLKMSSTNFHASNSYMLVLRMSKGLNKLANLAKNDAFEKKFWAGLTQFNYFREDLEFIFKKALKIRDDLIAVQSRLKTVFCDFLPDVVLRSLTEHLRIEDLPLDSL